MSRARKILETMDLGGGTPPGFPGSVDTTSDEVYRQKYGEYLTLARREKWKALPFDKWKAEHIRAVQATARHKMSGSGSMTGGTRHLRRADWSGKIY